MKYLIIYNNIEVVSVNPYITGTAVATNLSFLVETLETGRQMLQNMLIDTTRLDELNLT